VLEKVPERQRARENKRRVLEKAPERQRVLEKV